MLKRSRRDRSTFVTAELRRHVAAAAKVGSGGRRSSCITEAPRRCWISFVS
jgi:hypothetical protein